MNGPIGMRGSPEGSPYRPPEGLSLQGLTQRWTKPAWRTVPCSRHPNRRKFRAGKSSASENAQANPQSEIPHAEAAEDRSLSRLRCLLTTSH
jgi:hypothetical protein